jgi:hypothetical protein
MRRVELLKESLKFARRQKPFGKLSAFGSNRVAATGNKKH